MDRPGGKLVIISGPSGVGKTTVAGRLVARGGFTRVITATTRAPRDGEVDGRDYHFLAASEFERGIAEGRFLEHARVHGNLYGTPRAAVERALASGATVLLAIDVQGARQIRERAGDLQQTSIFLLAPDPEELVRRLGSRGTETAAQIARRLETARAEIPEQAAYDHVVVNDDLERTVDEIIAILARAGGGPARQALP